MSDLDIRDSLELVRRLNSYAFKQAPEEVAEKLQTIPGVDADKITVGREILYAHRDLLDEPGLTLLGQLASFAVYSGWTGENADGRCEKIRDGVRRDLGDAGEWGEPEDDPAPRAAYRDDQKDWRHPDEPPRDAIPGGLPVEGGE